MVRSISFFLIVAAQAGVAQVRAEQFDSLYSDLENARTLLIVGSFRVVGAASKQALEAEGTLAIAKNGWDIIRYRSFAMSRMPMVEKNSFENTLFDGNEVHAVDGGSGAFVNRGPWDAGGQNYIGSSAILYNNLILAFQTYLEHRQTIEIQETEDGFDLMLPPNGSRGAMIMTFSHGAPLPRRVRRYNTGGSDQDHVELLIAAGRINVEYPNGFFEVPTTSPVIARTEGIPEKRMDGAHLLPLGTVAPEWELATSTGVQRRLSDLKGKVVVLDFWATWCAPCVRAQPMLERIHREYQDVVVLGMNFNDKKDLDLNEYKRKKDLGYEMILNAEAIAETYKVMALPTAYVIDRSGRIVHASVGYSEAEENELMEILKRTVEQ